MSRTKSLIGMNVAPEYVSNIAEAERIIRGLNPELTLVLEGTEDPKNERKAINWAKDRRQEVDGVVGFRQVRMPPDKGGTDPYGGDGNYFLGRPVDQYVEHIDKLDIKDLWFVDENESKTDTETFPQWVDFKCDMMDKCYQIGQHLLIGNNSAGTPAAPPTDHLGKWIGTHYMDTPAFHKLVRTLNKYRGFHLFVEHAGAPGSLTYGVGTYGPEDMKNPALMREKHKRIVLPDGKIKEVPIRYERFEYTYDDGTKRMLPPTNYMLDRNIANINIIAKELGEADLKTLGYKQDNIGDYWIDVGYTELGIDEAGIARTFLDELSRITGAPRLVATRTWQKVFEFWQQDKNKNWLDWLVDDYEWWALRTYILGAALFTYQDVHHEWSGPSGHDLSPLTYFWDKLIERKLVRRQPPRPSAYPMQPVPSTPQPPIVVQPPTPTPTPVPTPATSWRDKLDERQRKEIALAEHYAKDAHGTDGHNRLLLIAQMAGLLDAAGK